MIFWPLYKTDEWHSKAGKNLRFLALNISASVLLNFIFVLVFKKEIFDKYYEVKNSLFYVFVALTYSR